MRVPAALTIVMAGGLASAASAAIQDTTDERERAREALRSMSLEELLQVTVVTPGRKEQSLETVSAAVTVIRGEDLRRLGIRRIPDALRYVPGASVVQIDGSIWAVSVRGFSSQFSTKLQVLVDGRSVYSPIFSGVFWDQQDTLLEDVDRIEIVRGPGASVWGANAVNGVINVITKKAKETQGGYASAGGGSEERAFAEGRWGGAAGEGIHYRAFAKGFYRDEQGDGDDDWRSARAGLRLDVGLGVGEEISISGEVFDSKTHHTRSLFTLSPPGVPQLFPYTEDVTGGFLSVRWEKSLDRSGVLSVRASVESSQFDRFLNNVRLDVYEIDVTHAFVPAEGVDVTWGASYRFSLDDIDNTFFIAYDPDAERVDIAGVFAQVEFDVVPGGWSITAGSKFEYYDATGFEAQPTLRTVVTPLEDVAVWAAVSRAVRTPSRNEEDVRINFLTTPPSTVFGIEGDHDVDSEELIAYEAGVRVRFHETLTADVAVFWNRYEDLMGQGASRFDPPPPFTEILTSFHNRLEGRTAGVEATVSWLPVENWTLTGTYAFLHVKMDEQDDGPQSALDEELEGEPRHRATLRSAWNLPWNLQADAGVRVTSHTSLPELSSWTELDARLGWTPLPGVEAGLVGQNLLHADHRERAGTTLSGTVVTEPERGVYAYLAWRF